MNNKYLKNIKHMLKLKSTWIILVSQLSIILKELGVLDEIGLQKYNNIVTALLFMATVTGVLNIYLTKPVEDVEKPVEIKRILK